MPTDVSNIHSSSETTVGSEMESVSSQDSDVAMLDLAQDINEHEGGWPTYLGILNRKHSLIDYEALHVVVVDTLLLLD